MEETKNIKQEMIDDVLDHFDFDKVQRVIEFLDQKWDIGHGEKVVPSVYRIIQMATRLLSEVYDMHATDEDHGNHTRYHNGLLAKMTFLGELSLTFIVEGYIAYED